ncbi:leucyl aminopeptidase [Streptomyces sp. AJS327]|uniref:leucyl aminopeptidase n=1 Tax=Streptomyces sp. AJS327 TaxID=2545265 RepID=UPI0015DEA202|nr:leucyl aminopeptidase [Streptomyces sp. AJS327]MBA0050244.1 leucyl aminopeptidase [Streptomyces sp. AJS327]
MPEVPGSTYPPRNFQRKKDCSTVSAPTAPTALTLSTSSVATLRADAVVIGVVKGRKGPAVASGGEAVDEAFGGGLTAALDALGVSGAEAEVVKLPAPADGVKAPVVLAVGLGDAPGKRESYGLEALRRAAGAAARALAGSKKAAFALPVEDAEAVCAVAEGALLGSYSFVPGRGLPGVPSLSEVARGKGSGGGKDGGRTAPLAEVAILGAKPRDKAHKAAAERAQVLGYEINRARDLINLPPNELTPRTFADHARTAAEEHRLEYAVLDEKKLLKDGYGGIMGVGQGSQNPPRLVRIAYTHPAAERTLALVGKGITYDSGGLSLKPPGHNETMKCDMSGAAAVLAATVAVARLGLPVNITGWLALAENMPSGAAVRPGDVLTMYGGTTVEVLNTDAEGRLVMADALTRACEEEPTSIVDVATLTGAMVLALGQRTFGVMGNDEAFRTAVVETADEAGEDSWPMPMPGHLRKAMDSQVADFSNMGERPGNGLLAGIFLKEFIPEDLPWAHLDIAGPAFNESGPYGYTPKGGTGSGVRTLVRLAERAADGELG